MSDNKNFCMYCGDELKPHAKFCDQCGKPVLESHAPELPIVKEPVAKNTMPVITDSEEPTMDQEEIEEESFQLKIDENAIVWEKTNRMIPDRFFMYDWGKLILITYIIVDLIGLVISVSSGEIAMFVQFLKMFSVIMAGFVVLMLLIILLFFWNHYRVRYVVTKDGVGYEMLSRRSRFANTLAIIVGILARKPGVAGAGLLAKSRESGRYPWEDVYNVHEYHENRVISIMDSWHVMFRFYCTDENYAQVVDAIHRYMPAAAEKRKQKKLTAGPSPVPRMILLSLLVLAASLCIMAFPFNVDSWIVFVVLICGLLMIWLPGIRGFFGVLTLSSLAVIAYMVVQRGLKTECWVPESALKGNACPRYMLHGGFNSLHGQDLYLFILGSVGVLVMVLFVLRIFIKPYFRIAVPQTAQVPDGVAAPIKHASMISVLGKIIIAAILAAIAIYGIKAYEKSQQPAQTNLQELTNALGPSIASTYNRDAAMHNVKKEFDSAIEDANNAIAADPNFAKAYLTRGTAYYFKGMYDKAIEDLNKAVEIDPENVLYYMNRGVIFLAKKEYDSAINDFDKIIAMEPGNTNAYVARGNAYKAKGDLEKALTDYTAALKIEPNYKGIELSKPDYATIYYFRGNVYRIMKEYGNAISDYSKAIDLDKNYGAAYYARGIAYYKKNEYDTAIEDYTKSISISPNPDGYIARGIAYTAKNNLEKAITDYSQAITINPQYALAYYNRGRTYEKLNQLTKAKPDLQKACSLGLCK